MKSYRSASAQLHRLQSMKPDDVVDVTDGYLAKAWLPCCLWCRSVILWETGQVLDTAILSKGCMECMEIESSCKMKCTSSWSSSRFRGTPAKGSSIYYIEGRCSAAKGSSIYFIEGRYSAAKGSSYTSLRDDVQLQREVPYTSLRDDVQLQREVPYTSLRDDVQLQREVHILH